MSLAPEGCPQIHFCVQEELVISKQTTVSFNKLNEKRLVLSFLKSCLGSVILWSSKMFSVQMLLEKSQEGGCEDNLAPR